MHDAGYVDNVWRSGRNGGTHYGGMYETHTATDYEATELIGSLYANDGSSGGPRGPITYHTWDADVFAWVENTYAFPGSPGVHVTRDHGATDYSVTSLGMNAIDDSFMYVGLGGWPLIDTSDPAVGVLVAFAYAQGSDHSLGGVRLTTDNGTTWGGDVDPTWSSLGCSYFELSLFPFIS